MATPPTTVTWTGPASGAWSAGTDWSGGAAPNAATTNVAINRLGAVVATQPGEVFQAGTVTLSNEAAITADGTLTLAALKVGGGGAVDVGAGDPAARLVVTGNVANQGLVAVDAGGGLTINGTLSGIGTLELFGAATATGRKVASVTLHSASTGTIEFASDTVSTANRGGVLTLDQPNKFDGQIVGFAGSETVASAGGSVTLSDSIVLVGIGRGLTAPDITLSYAGDSKGGALTLSAAGKVLDTLSFIGNYTAASFGIKVGGGNIVLTETGVGGLPSPAITWAGPASGAWETAANWSGGVEPNDPSTDASVGANAVTIAAGDSVFVGTLAIGNGLVDVAGSLSATVVTLTGNGQIQAASLVVSSELSTGGQGTLDLAASGSGIIFGSTDIAAIDLAAGASLDVGSLGGSTIDFTGQSAALTVDDPINSRFTVVGFSGVSGGASDTIDLGVIGQGLTTVDLSYSGDASGGTLAITDSSGYLLRNVSFEGAYSTASFAASVAGNDVIITETGANNPCFMAGTRIRTPEGDVAVEALAVGDIVSVAGGGVRRVVWLGRRGWDAARHPRPEQVLPVRILAGALGENVPARDLLVSPDHALMLAGVLVPAKHLVNEASIFQDRSVTRGVYWHVELEAHDVLLAEGAGAESYLDTGNRAAFEGGQTTVLHPRFDEAGPRPTCLPLALDGPAVAPARAITLARAEALGFVATDDPELHVAVQGRRFWDTRGRFELPADAGEAWLMSRSGVPAAMVVDSMDDRRLGVCVSSLRVDGVPVDLATLDLPGWHAPESATGAPRRWTDGRARLPAGARRVEVTLCGSLSYWLGRAEALAAVG